MTDIEVWLLGITSACLVVELVNTSALAYIIRWIGKAGSDIVGKISKSVGLNQGKGGSILTQVKDMVEKATGNNGNEEPIDLGEFGSYTPSQIKGFAQQFGSKLKAGTASLPQGATMGGLEALMQGKMPKNLWEALPLLMQFFGPNASQSNGSTAPPSRQGGGTAWDS